MSKKLVSNQQNVYELLLCNKNLQSLSNFRQRVPRQIYQTAQKYPSFFNSNLVSPGRVIKILVGPNAIIKGFYYQLMKICFEIQVAEIDYIELLKSKIFDSILSTRQQLSSSPISGQLYSDTQYKKFIAQFIQLLISQSIPNFELTINQYPIIDEALEKTFEAFLNKSKQQFSDNQQKLQYLSDMFKVGFIPYGKCFKFDQSDVFLYQENEEEIYMAYLNQMEEVSEADTSQPQNSQSEEKQYNLSQLEVPNDQSQSQANKSNENALLQPMAEISRKNSRHSYTQSQKISDIDRSNQHNIQNIKNSSLINIVQEVSKINNVDWQKNNNISESQNERQKKNSRKKKENKEEEENYQKTQKRQQNQNKRQSKDQNKDEVYRNIFTKVQKDTFGEKYQQEFNKHISQVQSFNLQQSSPYHSKVSEVNSSKHKFYIHKQQQENNKYSQVQRQSVKDQTYHININNPPANLSRKYNYQVPRDRHHTYNTEDMVTTEQRFNYPNSYENINIIHSETDKKSQYRQIEQELIYRPKKLGIISEMSSFKDQTASNFIRKNNGYELDQNESDSKGTFYKQFTATKILEFVKQPHRTKIKIMKNRFIGLRSKNLINKF